MQLILSPSCLSLTGSLGSGYGYHIQHRKNGFFTKRNSKGHVPTNGHWRFIIACAQMAKNRLYIADIRVSREELHEALWEARHYIAMQYLRLEEYHAIDILNLKTTFGL